MPWKNGGGVTHQVAVSPEGASLDGIEWRISLARVSADGPFSIFEGIDRALLVLRGSLALRVGHQEPRVLRAGMPPMYFRGEDDAQATVLDGPVTDLNVMTRRGRCCARIIPAPSPAPSATDEGVASAGPPDWTLFLLDSARADIVVGASRRALRRDDAVLVSGPGPSSLCLERPEAPAAFHRVDLWRGDARSAVLRTLRGDSWPC